ncbi:MAG TPA: branched-chain amino acid ABC transporter substrate-binding protein [Caldimonas sp.]|jgi:branched-chain amino acid transport system substrate-binding protein
MTFPFAERSRAFAATLLCLLATACGPRIPATIEIGVAQPLSGPSAARGQDLVNGATLAAADLNASGYKIAGKPVRFEIVPMDDKADKEEAKKVAQALVDRKVAAVIGHLSSDITEVVIPIYSSGNVPQLFTSSAAELTKLGKGNAFRLIANDELQARAIASYAGEMLKAAKVAVLYEDTAFGAPLAQDMTAALAKMNKKVDISEAVDNKTTNFAAFVAKLKAARPDVLVAMLRDNQLLPLFEQMNAAGLGEVPVIASSVAKTQKVLNSTTVKTLFLTSSFAEASEFTGGREFAAKFRAAYHSEPVWGAHYAYDAVFVLADTMRRVESIDPAALRAKLAVIDAIAPVTTTMRFNAEGEQRYGAISVYQKVDAKWEPLMRTDRW